MSMNVTPDTPTIVRQTSAREFLAVVFRRKWLILGLFFVTTLTVATVALSTKVVYNSSGHVLVKRGERESALSPYRQLFGDWEQDLGSEVAIVRSFPVVQRAREILQQEHGARYRLDGGRVGAEVMGKSNVLAIDYTDRDPETAQVVADAVIRAYIEYRQRNLSLSYPKQFFESEIEKVRAEMTHVAALRRNYTDRAGVVDVVEQKRNQLSLLSSLDARRSEYTSELAEAQSAQRSMVALQTHPEIDLPTIGPPHEQPYTNESALVELKRKVVDQQAHIAELGERYTDDSPEVANAKATLETLRGLLKHEVDARMYMSSARIDALQSKVAALDHDIAGIRGDLSTMPDKETAIQEMDRQLGILKLQYEDLIKKSGDAKATEFTTPPVSVVLLDPAGAASARNTRDYVRLALAPAFSLVVGVGLAFFIDGLDLTVRTAGQAEEAVELPVLAALTERRRRSQG